MKYLPAIKEYTEEDIIAGDQSIIDKIAFGGLVLLQGGKLALCFAAMATMPMVSAGKIGEDVHVTVSADEDDFYTNYFIYGIIAISMAAALLVERTIFQLMRWHSDHRDAINQSKLSLLQGELANAIKKMKEEKEAREEAEHECTLLRRTLERVQGELTREVRSTSDARSASTRPGDYLWTLLSSSRVQTPQKSHFAHAQTMRRLRRLTLGKK